MVYSRTVMTAESLFESSKVDVAVTVTLDAVSLAPMVTLPLESTVESNESIVHKTVLGAKASTSTTAVNCNCDPIDKLAVAGDTVTLTTAGVPSTNKAFGANGLIDNIFHVCKK
jgi:hypothetical protein